MLRKLAQLFEPKKTPDTATDQVVHPAAPPFLICSEVDRGNHIAGHIFQHRYGEAAPDVPRHFVAFYQRPDRQLVPLCYLHFRAYKSLFLVGGACTDGRAFAAVSNEHRAVLRATHGVFYFLLRCGFDKLQGECEAFFGYCGDARALEVDLLAGFEETDRRYILIHAPNGLSSSRRLALLDDIEALGPF